MTDFEVEEKWTLDSQALLVGKKVVDVRYMTEAEAEESMWYSRPIIIVFDDGTYLIPMADDEGNNGGSLFTSCVTMPVIPVI